jgi:anti-sigma B factor antagonist
MDITIDQTGPVPVAALIGSMDPGDADDALEDLYPLIASPGAKLIINLSELNSINSAGLSSLITLVTRSRLVEGRVVLVGMTPFVKSVFEVTRLDTWFENYPDMQTAQVALNE